MEKLAVAGREEVGGEEHKRVGPHQKGVLATPPSVVVEMTLCVYVCVCVCVCVCVLCVRVCVRACMHACVWQKLV